MVHIERDLDESIASLIQRTAGRIDADTLARHQRWLWEGKRKLLASVPHLTVRYDDLPRDWGDTPIMIAPPFDLGTVECTC